MLLFLCTSPRALAQSPNRWRVVKQLPKRRWPVIKLDIDDKGPLTVLHPAMLRAVFFAGDQNGWAVGDGGTVVHTTDGGESWNASIVNPKADLYTVFFIDAQRGWIGGSLLGKEVVYDTQDGGASWRREVRLGDFHLSSVMGIWFVDAQHGWIAAFAEDHTDGLGLVFQTGDGGKRWSQTYAGQYKNGLLAIKFLDQEHGWAIATDTILYTKDGGKNWLVQSRASQQPQDILFGLDFLSPSDGWAVGGMYAGEVLHTSNAGETWNSIPVPGTQKLPSGEETLFTTSVKFVNPSEGWIGSSDGAILSTEDGGKTWTVGSTGTSQTTSSVAVTSRAVFAVGTEGKILRRLR